MFLFLWDGLLLPMTYKINRRYEDDMSPYSSDISFKDNVVNKEVRIQTRQAIEPLAAPQWASCEVKETGMIWSCFQMNHSCWDNPVKRRSRRKKDEHGEEEVGI